MSSGRIRKSLAGNVDEALRLFSERTLWADLNLAETEFVLEEALKCYGSVQETTYIAELFALYRRYMGMAIVDRRQALLTRMTEFVSDGRQNRSMALLCFIASDTDGQIISGAALDLAMVLPSDKDPLAGPKLVAMHSCGGLRSMTGGESTPDEGHAAAGLLLLGDARLLPILKDIWGRLSTEGRNNMIKRRSGLAYAAIAEFALQRLEEDKDEVHFGELGALLHDLARIASEGTRGFVLDIRRNFGLPPGKEPMELVARHTVAEFYRRIEPRLKKLIERESTPKVLPAVLARWAEAAGVEQEGVGLDDEDGCDEFGEDEVVDGDEDNTLTISDELAAEFGDRIAPSLPQDGSGFPVRMWFNPYEEHSPVTSDSLLKELSAGDVFPLLLTGLFNPIGPTLTLYVVRCAPNQEWALWSYTLNPFRCTSRWLADLDNTKLEFAKGILDPKESERRRSLAFGGRKSADGVVVLRSLINEVLGRSRLLPQFTLCHFTKDLASDEAIEMVGQLLAAGKNASEDVANLRDPSKRDNPWSRVDPVAALQLSRGNVPTGNPIGLADKYQFATRVLSAEQRKIELNAILTAWDGALGMAKGVSPALDRHALTRILVNMTPDMPDLLMFGDQKAKPSPGVPSAPVTITPTSRIPNSTLPAVQFREEAKFTGLTLFLHNFGVFEIWISAGLLIYALTMSDWSLAFALFVFGFLSAARAGSMWLGATSVRWWGMALYLAMGGFVLWKMMQHRGWPPMPARAIYLHEGIVIWMGIMAFLHLICTDYQRQVAAAKKD